MNEQEKALQGMVEFCQWLLVNAKDLQLETSQGINIISQAKSADDPKILEGLEKLTEELGGPEELKKLTDLWQQSKSKKTKMAKHGTKIDYLINKFVTGGPLRYIKYDDRGRTISLGEVDNRKRLEDGLTNARILTLTNDGKSVKDILESNGSRVERYISNYNDPKADTTYIYYPNGSISPRIDIDNNNATYSDIYGDYRVIPSDSINYYRNLFDNRIMDRYQNGGELPGKYKHVKYDDRGRWISPDEIEERDRLNGEKNLREESINDDGHFITDRIDLDPNLRAYRFVHNYNLEPADTAYYFDFGNGHRIGIERDRGRYFTPNGSIPVNKNVTGLLQRMINKKLNR